MTKGQTETNIRVMRAGDSFPVIPRDSPNMLGKVTN